MFLSSTYSLKNGLLPQPVTRRSSMVSSMTSRSAVYCCGLLGVAASGCSSPAASESPKNAADCGVGVRKAKVICIDTVCSVDQFSEICVHCLTLSFTLFASWRAVESIANDLDQHTLISTRTVTIGFNLADSCLKSSLGSVSGLFLILASGCGICNNVVANSNFGRYNFDQGSGYLVTVSCSRAYILIMSPASL